MNVAICSRVISLVKYRDHKLTKFRKQYHKQSESYQIIRDKHVIDNFSSCDLSPEEVKAVPF